MRKKGHLKDLCSGFASCFGLSGHGSLQLDRQPNVFAIQQLLIIQSIHQSFINYINRQNAQNTQNQSYKTPTTATQ